MRKCIIRNVSNNKSATKPPEVKHEGANEEEMEKTAIGYWLMRPDELEAKIEFINEFEVRGDVPPHSHSDAEEIWYVIEGEGYVQLGDEKEIRVGPRDMIYTPVGVPHGIRPEKNKTVRCFGFAIKIK